MKSKISLILIILTLGLIVFFALHEDKKESYVEKSQINYDVKSNGSISVKEKEVLYLEEGTEVSLFLLVPTKDILFDEENYKLINNSIQDVSISITDENGKKTNNIPYEILNYDMQHKRLKLDYKFYMGKYIIEANYTLPASIEKYEDVAMLYTYLIPFNSKYPINELSFTISFDSKFNITSTQSYLYKNNEIYEERNSKIIKHKFNNIEKGEKIQFRVLFDKDSINGLVPSKVGRIKEVIQKNIDKIEYRDQIVFLLDIIAIIISIVMIGYFVYLLIKYDYQDLNAIVGKSYEEVLETINPVVGACILQERNAERKDVLPLLLKLVEDKVLNLKVKKYDDERKYFFSLSKDIYEKLNNLNNMELEVLDVFFKNKNEYLQEIELEERINKIKGDYSKTIKLEGIVQKLNSELNDLGANNQRVSNFTKTINIIFLVLTFILFFTRIICKIATNVAVMGTEILTDFNLFENLFQILSTAGYICIVFGILIFLTEAIVLVIIYICSIIEYIVVKVKSGFKTYVNTSTKSDKINFKSTIRNVMRVSQKFIIVYAFILALIINIEIELIAIPYAILILIIGLIVINDDHMSKHSQALNETYVGLKFLEEKIINGSYLTEKDFESNIVWGKYVTFTLALGVSENEDYSELINNNKYNYLAEKKLAKSIFNFNLILALFNNFLTRNTKDMYEEDSWEKYNRNNRYDMYNKDGFSIFSNKKNKENRENNKFSLFK